MKRLLLALTLAVSFATPSSAISDVAGVVDSCERVAGARDAATDTNPWQGRCLGATSSFLTTLQGLASSLSPDELDQQIADLIIAIAPLAGGDGSCNGFDDEVARAVALASNYSSSPGQRAQLVKIGQSVASCDDEELPAILEALRASPTG